MRDELRSLTAWGMKPLVVWWYGSGYFCIFFQMFAKWTEFGLDCCCVLVSFGLYADNSLYRCHWCSSRWVPIIFRMVSITHSRVFLSWAMNEEWQFVMFPCFLLFLDSTHFYSKWFNFGWFLPLIPCVCSISSGYYLSSMFWLPLALPLSLPFGLKWITQEVTTESLTAWQLTRLQWCSDFCVKSWVWC